ncbi:MAG: sodium:calcium antiporter [Gemmatimonadetes bacterium]|nr:sodium:calcium antiporter [Gemmatimonadota bacterium]NNL30429.1 sodium:calcium antiporter [Gemmatimonadota bacterium]
MTTTILLYVAILVASSAATWFGSVRLERSAGFLSRHYGLPPLVHGTLVVAVASSLPELTTVVASALIHGDFELGMASIVGSAIFNILVIPGLSALVDGRALSAELRLVYRDAQFYLTSVAVLLLTFSFALIYAPVTGADLTGSLTRRSAMVPLLLYGLYLFLQQQEVQDERGRRNGGGKAPNGAARSGPGSAQRRDGRRFRLVAKAWLMLVVGIGLVIAGVDGLLRVAIGLGDALGTPSFLWGATVVAAATSVPDAIISLRGARRGDGDLSIGNVLGSNVFDLLVAIPAGVLIAGAAVVDYRVAAPLMAFLTLATVVLFTFLRTSLELSRAEGWVLLTLYAAFVVWLALETTGVTMVLGRVGPSG